MSSQTYKIAVVGAGSWGTAIANLLALNGHSVTIWARRAKIVDEINQQHANSHYLPNASLAPALQATADLSAAVAGTQALVFATPSAALIETAEHVAGISLHDVPVLILTKGIFAADASQYLFSEKLSSILDNKNVSVLSGPTHAEEVVRQKLTAAVVASEQALSAEFWQNIISNDSFRVYTSNDLTGVQLLGAGKNVIAIACGIAAQSDCGDNAQALIMTRGLAELTRLIVAAGGQSATAQGLAGMGDLIVTCTSTHSRNRSFGQALVKGETLTQYEARTGMVVEGAAAVAPLSALAAQLAVELPICLAVARAIKQPQQIPQLIANLSARSYKPENY